MRSLLDSEIHEERRRGEGGEAWKSKMGSLTQSLAPRVGRDPELDPCLACVQRMRKAAIKTARFGALFTQTYRFSAIEQTFEFYDNYHWERACQGLSGLLKSPL
jgi:hypothetical protein